MFKDRFSDFFEKDSKGMMTGNDCQSASDA